MKNILVPCDFSKSSDNAFLFALDVASRSPYGTIHLLNVVELPAIHDTLGMPVASFESQLLKEIREKGEDEYRKFVNKFQVADTKIEFDLEFGSVTRKILDYVNHRSIDLIIMGSHGASGFREYVIGSNAEKIVRSATVPVIIVKQQGHKPIRNIVFPNTLQTEGQEDLVNKVKELQHFYDATLHIVWINTPVNFTSDLVTKERMKAFVEHHNLKDYTTSIFNYPNEQQGIIEFSRMIEGDMIAMATHGHKGLSHVLLGSFAEDVVNHTEKLIWTYSLKNATVMA